MPTVKALKVKTLLFEEKELHQPPVDDIINVLNAGLQSNFAEVTVDSIECPNLQNAPYHLAASGLNGSPLLLEIGGAPYLLPLVQRSKLYDLKAICDKIYADQNIDEYLAIGAGAGPWPLVNTNCEGIYNVHVAGNQVHSESHLARVDANLECVLEKIPNTTTDLAVLGNIFVSEGKPGKVIRVRCKQRTGTDDFIASIRKSLETHYTGKTVGLGGVFLLKSGRAKQHVMQDFSTTPINTEDELNTWLKFYDMESTLIAVGTLVTDEADLDLRLQHFHSFSTHGIGGHYHIDTTPDVAEYEGLFVVGEKVVRVDKPAETHKMGRD